MKKLIILILVLSLTVVFAVSNVSIGFNAMTGDKELDVSLSNLNVEANLNIKTFNKEMTANFAVTEKKLEMLRAQSNMQPSDIYMAFEISKASDKPVEKVISSYKSEKEKGWGVIAKKMGIKPGSDKFKKLKKRVKEKHQKKEKNKKQKNKPKKNKKESKSKGKK